MQSEVDIGNKPLSTSATNRPQYISLLSSSPCKPDDVDFRGLESHYGSSPLPIRKKPFVPSLKPGSRAAPIPQDAVTGFQKASNLVLDPDSEENGESFKVIDKRERSTVKSLGAGETSAYFSKDFPKSTKDDSIVCQISIPQTRGDKQIEPTPLSVSLESLQRETDTALRVPVYSQSELGGSFGYNHLHSKAETEHAYPVPKPETKPADVDDIKKPKNADLTYWIPGIKSKAKTSAKKSLTITARAIEHAQVNIGDGLDDGARNVTQVPSVAALDFASLCKSNSGEHVTETSSKKRNPSRCTVTKSSKKAGKRRQISTSQKLRSPSSAIERMKGQDFVFGTCSQIERDEEATYIKDLELALKVSAMADRKFLTSHGASRHSGLHQTEGSRNLWSAAARGADDGYLLSPEPLAERKPESYNSLSKPGTGQIGDDKLSTEAAGQTKKLDGTSQEKTHPSASSSSFNARLRLSSGQSTKPRMISKVLQSHQSTARGATVIADILSVHTSTQVRSISTDSTKRHDSAAMSEATHSHNLSWNAKEAPAETNQQPGLPKRRRGRPPKISASAEENPSKRNKSTKNRPIQVDEIVDYDCPTPSPPRLPSARAQGQLKLSSVENMPICAQNNDAEAKAKSEELQRESFALITRAVKSAPRSKDPKHPSWYEKILLYDPIALEEFTEWLNADALRAVRAETEVSTSSNKGEAKVQPNLVRKWCEHNGVCCIWKKNS